MDINIRIYNKKGFKNVKGENIFCEVPNCHNNSVYRILIIYDLKEYYLCDKHYTHYHNFMARVLAKFTKEQKIAMNKVINGEEPSLNKEKDEENGVSNFFLEWDEAIKEIKGVPEAPVTEPQPAIPEAPKVRIKYNKAEDILTIKGKGRKRKSAKILQLHSLI